MKKLLTLLLLVLSFLTLASCFTNTPISQSEDTTLLTLDYSTFKELNYEKDNVTLYIDGVNIDFKLPVYIDKNRYYFSISDIVNSLGGKINKVDEDILKVTLKDKSYTINNRSNTIDTIKGENIPLKKQLINSNNFYFISFTDLSSMLNMNSYWNRDTKTILCKTNDSYFNNISKYTSKINTIGLIRLEDITSSLEDYDKDYFNKLRVMANYLHSKSVPYHIAWIPRSVDPIKNYDLDPLAQNSFILSEMIYSLDYFTSHSGVIGLHGYTHQSNKEISGVGTEFGSSHPSVERFNDRISKAVTTANELDIKIDFFEAPHYAITKDQNIAAEKMFKYLFYPFNDKGISFRDNTKPQLSPYNGTSYYYTTPLDYAPGDNPYLLLNNIRNSNTKNMGNLFYHPRLEFSYINYNLTDNIPNFSYSEDAFMKKIINELENKGYNMIKITESTPK